MRAGGHGFPTRPLGAAAAGAALTGVQAEGMHGLVWRPRALLRPGVGEKGVGDCGSSLGLVSIRIFLICMT